MWGKQRMSGNKYRAKPLRDASGTYWHSRGELGRYRELQLLEAGGAISNLKRQQKFSLKGRNGKHICFIIVDFTYREGKAKIADDFKSGPTLKREDFRIKRALFRDNYPEYELRISQRRQA